MLHCGLSYLTDDFLKIVDVLPHQVRNRNAPSEGEKDIIILPWIIWIFQFPFGIWDFPLFYVIPFLENCPSSRCATVANSVCNDFYTFCKALDLFRFDSIIISLLQADVINYLSILLLFLFVLRVSCSLPFVISIIFIKRANKFTSMYEYNFIT
jgi:hypothetical protein